MVSSPTKRYKYQKEDNEYVLFDGDKKVCNPDGEVVSAENEDLAVKLVQALEDGEDYTSARSLLCYHYTYCNLRQHTIEEFVDEFSSYMTYDAFLWDDYLMFKQGAPVKQAFAAALSGQYTEMIKSFNKYQFIAILVLHQVYNSWMLSYRIINDIISQLDSSSYDELKDDFMEELDDFDRTEFADKSDWGEELDEEQYSRYRYDLSETIDKFVFYFCLK